MNLISRVSEIRKLKISVIFGWAVIIFWLISCAINNDNSAGLIWVIIILSLRYSLFKPVSMIGSAIAGWLLFSFWDYFFNRSRSAESGPVVFFMVLVFGLAFTLLKGAILSAYFLIRETVEWIRIAKYNTSSLASLETAAASNQLEVNEGYELIQGPLLNQKHEPNKYFQHLGPALIAKRFLGNTEEFFGWDWTSKSQDRSKSSNRLLLIGGTDKGKSQTIERLCEAHFKHDPMAVFSIAIDKEVTGKECWLGGALKDLELIADSELQLSGDMKEFGEVTTVARQFFCDTYMEMLAEIKGVNREDLFPYGTNYNARNESPLKGYANYLQSSPHRDFLEFYTGSFGVKPWVKTEQGYYREFPKDLTVQEKALLLFETIWEMYHVPALFSLLKSGHHFIFNIEVPNEVLIDERYEAWFQGALQHLLWRADWVNYDFTVTLSIDSPNLLCRLPIHHHVLFDKKHSDEYMRLTNITIPAEQMKALHHVGPGTCLWINYISDNFHSLKLNTVDPVEFAKN